MHSGVKFIPRDQIDKNEKSDALKQGKKLSRKEKGRSENKSSQYSSSDEDPDERLSRGSKRKKWYSSDEYSLSSHYSESEDENRSFNDEKRHCSRKTSKYDAADMSKSKKKSRSGKEKYGGKKNMERGSQGDISDCGLSDGGGANCLKDMGIVRKEIGLEWMLRPEAKADRKPTMTVDDEPDKALADENYVKTLDEITPEMMRVVDAFQHSLTREEMREIADQSRHGGCLTTMLSSLAQTSIAATRLISLWKEHIALKSQMTELESQMIDQEMQLHCVKAELQRSREDQIRARKSFMKISQKLTTARGELATVKREVSEMTFRIKELESELIETKRELTSMRSSFDEAVTARANEQAAEQIGFVMDALERRFPGADHTWIYGDDHADDDTSNIPPFSDDRPLEAAEDITIGGSIDDTEDAPGGSTASITYAEGSTADIYPLSYNGTLGKQQNKSLKRRAQAF